MSFVGAGATDAENVQHLQVLSPPGTNVYNSIYETDPTGYVWRFVQQCNRCNNIGNGVPATTCF